MAQRYGVFRDGSYARHVLVGKRTVKEGECLSVWGLDGRQRVFEGPRRKYLWRSNIRFQDRFQADQNQYLVVLHRSGRREHIRGPIALFADPVRHQNVEVRDVISVDAFECLIVYREDQTPEEGGATPAAPMKSHVERRIVRGPVQFAPAANEWVHEFRWHGLAGKSPDETLVAGANKFTKLRIIPDQLYYSTQVRTSDDVLLTVKLMIFYEISQLEKMLDSTSDPIGDIVNALCADLITFAATVSYEKFLEVSASFLNDINTFPLIQQRAQAIGFTVTKLVYRGYSASAEVQRMHEANIKNASSMRIEHDHALQAHELEDIKLNKQASRAEREREIAAAQHAETMRQKEMEHEHAMRQRAEELRHEEQHIARMNEEQVSFLEKLRRLGVDLTQYLVSQNSKADRVIRVEGAAGAKGGPNILVDTK